jgi:hypothetical protein
MLASGIRRGRGSVVRCVRISLNLFYLDELELTDAGGEDPDGAVRGARGAGAELHVRQWTLECCILRTSMTRNGVKSASFPFHSLHSAEDFLNIYQ